MKKFISILILSIFLITAISATLINSNFPEKTKEINIHDNNSINPILAENKKDLPKFIITGFAVYNENKNIIVPVYYSLIAFLAIILLFNIVFKKTPMKNLKEEAEDLLNKERLKEIGKDIMDKKERKEEIYETEEKEYKKEMESIPEMEPYSDGKEINKKIKEEETDVDEKEVFKESEEVLESEIKEEIKEEKENPKNLPKKGQPTPIDSNTGKTENTKKLINEAEKLEDKK